MYQGQYYTEQARVTTHLTRGIGLNTEIRNNFAFRAAPVINYVFRTVMPVAGPVSAKPECRGARP